MSSLILPSGHSSMCSSMIGFTFGDGNVGSAFVLFAEGEGEGEGEGAA